MTVDHKDDNIKQISVSYGYNNYWKYYSADWGRYELVPSEEAKLQQVLFESFVSREYTRSRRNNPIFTILLWGSGDGAREQKSIEKFIEPKSNVNPGLEYLSEGQLETIERISKQNKGLLFDIVCLDISKVALESHIERLSRTGFTNKTRKLGLDKVPVSNEEGHKGYNAGTWQNGNLKFRFILADESDEINHQKNLLGGNKSIDSTISMHGSTAHIPEEGRRIETYRLIGNLLKLTGRGLFTLPSSNCFPKEYFSYEMDRERLRGIRELGGNDKGIEEKLYHHRALDQGNITYLAPDGTSLIPYHLYATVNHIREEFSKAGFKYENVEVGVNSTKKPRELSKDPIEEAKKDYTNAGKLLKMNGNGFENRKLIEKAAEYAMYYHVVIRSLHLQKER